MSLGVYVHFPYCSRRCPYCDFTITVKSVEHDLYRAGVLAELAVRARDFADRAPPVSVYFGGGTPGLWRADCVAAVIDAVRSRFGLQPDAEITVECNPEEVTLAHMLGLRAAGVNRISLGVQSFEDRWLNALGRGHDGAMAARAIDAIQAVGIARFSVDLIHGMVGQSVEAACSEVTRAVELGARHVSTYQLTIEPKTAFGARARRGEQLLSDDTRLIEMYTAIRSTLVGCGLQPYEISSAAAPGHQAVHNRLHWTDGEYLGLGVGAHGYRHLPDGGGTRWSNVPQIPRWHAAAIAGTPLEAERVRFDAAERLEDRVMCGLRMDVGVAVDPIMQQRYGRAAARLQAAGLLRCAGGRWAVTDQGRGVLDRVTLGLLADPDDAVEARS